MIAHADLSSHLALAAAGIAAVAWTTARPSRHQLRDASCVAVGVVAALVVLSPPAEDAATRSYTFHMVQHLTIILITAPLLAACLPAPRRHPLHPRGVGPSRRRRIRDASHVAFGVAYPVTLLATHLTPWYDAAIGSQRIHDLEHFAYLASAFALWRVVVRSRVARPASGVIAVFGTIAATAIVGVVLTTAASPLVDAYALRNGADAAVADQRRAGAIMWSSGMATCLPLLVLAMWRWATAEQHRRERRELLTDRPPVAERTRTVLTASGHFRDLRGETAHRATSHRKDRVVASRRARCRRRHHLDRQPHRR